MKVQSDTLDNGLRVVLVSDPVATEVQVTMRYQVGAVDDPDGQAGLAHLVEHLMYQQVIGAQSVFAHLQDDTTYFNGETTLDATSYVARATPAHLDELLSIEATRASFRCVMLSDSVFERERAVVVNEVRERPAAAAAFRAALAEGLYPVGHPYRRRTTETPESVGALTHAQACAFADAHYAPNNAVLVVSGKIDLVQVGAALKRLLVRVPRRPVAASPAVRAASPLTSHVASPPGIATGVLVLAWPRPADPRARALVRALEPSLQAAVDAAVKGEVVLAHFGDVRAPLVALVIVPGHGETLDGALTAATMALGRLPVELAETGVLGKIELDQIRQTAIYRSFAALEEGGDRDARFASQVLANQDPTVVLEDELIGLRELTQTEAAAVARARLGAEQMTVVRMEAVGDKARAGQPAAALDLAAPVHDLGQRREAADPALAHQPVAAAPTAPAPGGMTVRTLPNGLRVVLLPMTSVPTVDVRLVFATGTADDPAGKRGTAELTADTLTWDPRYLNDWINYASAGGTSLVAVDADRTTFEARGLDMHLDLLLAGLRRRVREGQYDTDPAVVIAAARRRTKTEADDEGLTDAWHAAVYGAGHPYFAAGRLRYASSTLVAADTDQFRAMHYTPDNATLVIAGQFDAALAARWIDFLFGDWTGHAAPRSSPRAASTPAALARAEDTALVELTLALPATHGDRAQQLVLAELLADVVDDVRHQLGASYGLHAELAEQRLARMYVIGGRIAAPRTRDAVELVQTRIAQLRSDETAAARAFVTARARVLLHLASSDDSALGLAARIAQDVALQREPGSASATEAAVRALTIEAMAPALGDLDLAQAVVLMRGPASALDPAFAVLGRTPAYLPATTATTAALAPAPTPIARVRDGITLADIEPAITTPYVPSATTVLVGAGFSLGHTGERDTQGTLVVDLLRHVDARSALGVHAAVGLQQAASVVPPLPKAPEARFTFVPIDLAVCVRASGSYGIWGSIYAGVHVEQSDPAGWSAAAGAGVMGGVELLSHPRLGLFGQLQATLLADPGYFALTLGITYRP